MRLYINCSFLYCDCNHVASILVCSPSLLLFYRAGQVFWSTVMFCEITCPHPIFYMSKIHKLCIYFYQYCWHFKKTKHFDTIKKARMRTWTTFLSAHCLLAFLQHRPIGFWRLWPPTPVKWALHCKYKMYILRPNLFFAVNALPLTEWNSMYINL